MLKFFWNSDVCRTSTIAQNPKELRPQFLLLEFLLSIFRRKFDNRYCPCLFHCPISMRISTIHVTERWLSPKRIAERVYTCYFNVNVYIKKIRSRFLRRKKQIFIENLIFPNKLSNLFVSIKINSEQKKETFEQKKTIR